MVTLNLSKDPTYELTHSATSIKVPMTDKEFLEREIQLWINSPERRLQILGEQYYEGEQEICYRKREVIGEDGEMVEDKKLPNNKIVDNQYAKMVDQKANYFCGLPFTFSSADSDYTKMLNEFFDAKKRRKIRIAAEKALCGGKCWFFPFYDNNGLNFTVWSAHEVLPFWKDAEHTELDCAIHVFDVYEYDENKEQKTIVKVEVLHGNGIERMIWDGTLKPDPDAQSGSYITVTDKNGKTKEFNWEKMPLICFKANHREIPLLKKVKCLQDALNLLMSNLINSAEEDIHNTILTIKNYDGESLGDFRRNLAQYAAVKVRDDGGISTLSIDVNAENQKVIIDLIKKAIIENARGFDAKDERLNGSPNKMNIQSMYSDVDLDNNAMIIEFQAAFVDMLFFINSHFKNTFGTDYSKSQVDIIFNPDILVNEAETIENCSKSQGILSEETIIRNHPWIKDAEKELELIRKEQSEQVSNSYEGLFPIKTNEGLIDEE